VCECFDIVVSRVVSTEELERLLSELLPGCEVGVTRRGEAVPEEFPAVLVTLGETNDPDWPCVLEFTAFPDDSPLGECPDLRLAEYLSPRLGVSSLCDPAGLVPGLDPCDPYWFLARVEGRWYLADASNSPLMGPYTDGTTTFRGDQPIRLKHEVELSSESGPAAP